MAKQLTPYRNVIEKILREKYPSGSVFTSHFGAPDIVNEDFKWYIDDYGEIYLKGQNQFRLVYNDWDWS